MPVLQPLIPAAIQDDCVAEGWITSTAAKKLVAVPEKAPLPEFLDKVRELIVSRPDWTAVRLGIPELARLGSLPAVEKPLTLKRAGDLYFQRRKRTTPDWARKQRRSGRSLFKPSVSKLSAR